MMRAINLIVSVCCLVITVDANFFPYFYTPPLKQLQPIDALFGNVQPVHPYFQYQGQQLPSSYQSQEPNVQAPPTYQSQDSSPTVPNNYRGFGYHTNYDDGASATVVFLTGGNLQNNPALFFPNRITVASDNLDPQRIGNVQETVEKALNERKVGLVIGDQQNSFFGMGPFVQSFLQNPFQQTGLVYFYQGEGFPASTSPLTPPISSMQNQNVQDNRESVTQSTVINDNLEDDTLSVDAAAARNLPTNNYNNETSSTTNIESTSAEASTSSSDLANDPLKKQFVNINNDTTSSTSNIIETSTIALSTKNTNSTEDPGTTTNTLTLDTMATNGSTTEENSNVTNSS